MTTNDKADPTISQDGAIEIHEAQLNQIAGGATDFLLEIDGIKGESSDSSPLLRPLTSTTATRK